MTNITIHRCPVCSQIGNLSRMVEMELKRQPDVHVEVVDGMKGEFRVDADDTNIYSLDGDLPTPDEVIATVNEYSLVGVSG